MVYLIHLQENLHHARHYLGWSPNETTFKRRLWHHKKGTGAGLLRAANERGIKWKVVRQWQDNKPRERRLHDQNNNRRLCPICNPDTWMNREQEHTVYPVITGE